MLDTNACIGIINDQPAGPCRQAACSQTRSILQPEVAILAIVHYELAFGVCNSGQPQRNRANLMHFLKYVQVLDWGMAQSEEAAGRIVSAANWCARGPDRSAITTPSSPPTPVRSTPP